MSQVGPEALRPSSGGSNLETALQEFATALESERSGLWEAAWVIHRVVGPSTSMLSRKERKVMFGAFASVGNCTAAWVAQLHAVAEAFPSGPDLREPMVGSAVCQDKSISWHRKVAQRAKSLKRSVSDLAQEALDKGWSQFELDQIGKRTTVRSSLVSECKECHAKVRIKAKDLKGLMIPCPVCVGIKYEGVPDRPYDGFLGRLG